MKIKKLDLNSLREELTRLPTPNYVTKRFVSEIQKKINEIIEVINQLEKEAK